MAHNVKWVRIIAPGICDREVLALAAQEGGVALIFDKDFGERTRLAKLSALCSVVLFRIPMPQVRDAARLANTVDPRTNWAGHFSVVEPRRIHMRDL